MSDDSDDSDDARSSTYDSDVWRPMWSTLSSWMCWRFAPQTHGRFRGMQCWWCDRLTMPTTYCVANGGVASPACDLCELENFAPVLRKSTAMLTVNKFLGGRFDEDLAHFVTVAIFTSLCGSFWGAAAPLARIHHVYCTVLQSNSPFLALQLASSKGCSRLTLEAESPGAVAAALSRPPSDALRLILEFVYYELT